MQALRRYGFGVVVCGAIGLPVQAAAQDEPAAVLSAVQTFFDGMRDKDTVKVLSTVDPVARLIAVTPAGEIQAIPMAQFLRAVSGPRALDERIYDPEIRVDRNLATVWAWYDITVDGQFSHCGVDAFQLTKGANGWRITQIADSRQREGCTTARAKP